MNKRQGITLLEIIVAIACMGLLIFTGWSIFHNVINQSSKAISNVSTQTEAKHVVESLVSIVKNATELEVLNTTPTIEQMESSESQYVYSDNGVVHYFDGITDVTIREEEGSFNELLFSGDNGKDILKYRIKSKNDRDEYVSESSIILNNLENGIDNLVGSGNCIRFKAESNIAVIVEFNLLKSNNSLEEDIIGYVADGYIEVWVPSGVNVATLKPSVKFFGDEVVVSSTQLTDQEAISKSYEEKKNNYELQPKEIDFTNAVYYYVIRNDVVKEYVVTIKSNESMAIEITQQRVPVAGEKVIVFDEDFIANVSSDQRKGTYEWYVQGVSKPIKIEDNTTGVPSTLTVKELANHNNKDNTQIKDGIDDSKYDSNNPNDNEDAMLYLTVKFRPTGSSTIYTAEPVLIYPVTRDNLGKEFDDFYFKIATDVWVKSRMLEETVDSNTGKSGKDMAAEFVRLYAANTKQLYDAKSVKLNNKTGTEMSKTKATADGNIAYDDITNSYKFGYDKAPDLIRTMYKIESNGTGYKITPTIFTYGDNTTSTAPVINGDSKKHSDAPYSRTAFSIDVEYFMKEVNTLKNDENKGKKISNISSVDMYEFEVTYKPAKLESVNNKPLDVAEKMDIKKMAIGVFTDKDGNGHRYMTGSGAEPQLPNKGYLKVVGHSGISSSVYMLKSNILVPTESPSIYFANYLQEYVLDNNLKSPESITMRVNTVRQTSTFNQSSLEQGKGINTYVEILKDGKTVTGQIPTPANTGMTLNNVNLNLFSSLPTISSSTLGTASIYVGGQGGLLNNEQTVVGLTATADGYGKPSYIGTCYGTSYDEMLIGDSMYSAGNDYRIGGNPIRTNTTKAQAARTFGSNTMGNYITIGSANDSHTKNGAPRSTSGDNANISLDNDQYAHYISDFKLGAGEESEALEVKANIIGNLTIDSAPATVIEMKFNKPIRSGYGPEMYKNDGVTPAHIDTEIFDFLKSKLGKDIKKVDLDQDPVNNKETTGARSCYVHPFYSSGYQIYEPNLNPYDIKIKELKADGTMGTTSYEIFKDNNLTPNPTYYPQRIGIVSYIYKTGEDTLVAIINGKLDVDETYGIEFKRGSVQAMKLGAVPIKNGKLEPAEPIEEDKHAWNIIPDGLEVDENGNIKFAVDLSETGGHVDANVTVEGDAVYMNAAVQYYRDTGYIRDDLRGKVNLKDGFSVTVKSMKKTNYDRWNNQAFSAITVYNDVNDIGYALSMTDYAFEWGGDFDTVVKPNFGIHAIKNHLPMNVSGQVISASNYTNYEMIGLRSGKVYYDRIGGKYYTYKATFKNNTIKLEVFDESDKLIDSRNVTIPNEQYNLQKELEFDTIDIQSGTNNTYFKQISVDYLD